MVSGSVRMVLIAVLLVLVGAGSAHARDYELQARYPDLRRGDGFAEEGSIYNPYVIRDQYGQELAEVRPRFYDLNPGDGFFENGSPSNPYVIEWNN